MPATSLQDLYTQKLQLLLDAEQQGLSAMPQLVQQVQNEQLRMALQQHHQQTEQQVQRLQQLIGNRQSGESMQNAECISMRALIQEAQMLLPNIQDPDTIDAFIIGAQQAIEHHEIAAYGTARTWAQQLGFDEDADLLQETLDEEGQADKMLTQIAERSVNEQASQGSDREVGISSGGQGDRMESSDMDSTSSSDITSRGADMR
jgi:ferritin-like metal-binding protein YciE